MGCVTVTVIPGLCSDSHKFDDEICFQLLAKADGVTATHSHTVYTHSFPPIKQGFRFQLAVPLDPTDRKSVV